MVVGKLLGKIDCGADWFLVWTVMIFLGRFLFGILGMDIEVIVWILIE